LKFSGLTPGTLKYEFDLQLFTYNGKATRDQATEMVHQGETLFVFSIFNKKITVVSYQPVEYYSYVIKHNYTLEGSNYFMVTGNVFCTFLYTTVKYVIGDNGHWLLYTILGDFVGHLGRFCPWETRLCNSTEGDHSLSMAIYLEKDDPHKGLIINKLRYQLNGTMKKYIVSTYTFLKTNDTLEKLKISRLETITTAIRTNDHVSRLRSFQLPKTGDILVVGLDNRKTMFYLPKTDGFRKREISQSIFKPSLTSPILPGDVVADELLDRMLIMSETLKTRTDVIKAFPLNCTGVWPPANQVPVSVVQALEWSYFSISKNGIFISYKSSGLSLPVHRVVPEYL
jgi:hypothetical protein